jgi:cytochrome P450
MTLSQDVRFLGTMAQPLGHAARVNTARAFRGRWRQYRFWTGAEITDYDPIDPEHLAQPHEAYRALHTGGRVQYNPKLGLWILSRLPDVRAGARAAETLSSADGVTRLRMAGPLLVTMDGKRHNEMRRHVLPAFTKAALESWQALIDGLAVKLVGEVLDNPGCDVMQRLAIPMPMLLIAHMLGIPDGDIDDFRRWSAAAVRAADVDMSRRGMTSLKSSIGGIRDIYRYFRQQFAVGGLKGSDTVLGKLLSENASGSIDDDELFFFAMLLLIAGNETTTNLLGGMFDVFAQHPEKFDMVRADHSLIPKVVEEQLRFSSPVQGLYRTARTDYPVGPVTIPAGARVLLCLGAANRDPQVFDEPDEFRVDRNPTEHIAFGFGAHLCLGAQLTRMEARAILRELVTRTRRIEVIGETQWSANSTLRGPVRMSVRLTPSVVAG